MRVVATAEKLCEQEKARWEIVAPAAWLHDIVSVPKNDPRRSRASRLSAEEACRRLRALDYPEQLLGDIGHAIEAHSFSANIEPRTPEACIVQDADRLDGIGAIGVARCFAVAGMLRRPFYEANDPFCRNRTPDDSVYTVDHFYAKLIKTAKTLKTNAGREEGARRLEFMNRYLSELEREIAQDHLQPS